MTKKSDLLTQKQLWLQTVQLSGILAANGITYQTSDVNYVNASNHLWASPLEQQLMQNLVNELSITLPNRLVSAQLLENRPNSHDEIIREQLKKNLDNPKYSHESFCTIEEVADSAKFIACFKEGPCRV